MHIRKRRELRDVHDILDDEYNLRPLQILSILSNSTLLYYEDHDEDNSTNIQRKKREQNEWSERLDNNDDDQVNEEIVEADVSKQFKDILFVRKKHQKNRSTKKQRGDRKTNIRLMFGLMPQAVNIGSDDIEEANLRLVLIHSPTLSIRNQKSKKKIKYKNTSCGLNKFDREKNTSIVDVLNLKLFFLSKTGKRTLLDGRKVDIHVDLTKPDETHTQWLQFDVTQAVKTTLADTRLQNVVLELQCGNCKRIGARILNDAHNTVGDAQDVDSANTEGYQLMPVLNIIGRFGQNNHTMRPHKYESVQHNSSDNENRTQRQYHHQVHNNNKNQNHHNRRTNCYKANQHCCRHAMEVTFKEIKGFEFIIQPKVFDAGYCQGRCPPRYNPAHHHAMLQSLISQQNRQKAPRPCCAPSKLVELEVLHVDEKDNEKLKISTWSDMKVVECACS